ncbi:uncharacterized protein [Procambarus clarkii]|uniref:uncharacterized protein n=1 Tax=Procambarus clarkii TaxID=6728 RepID=UPI003742FDCB
MLQQGLTVNAGLIQDKLDNMCSFGNANYSLGSNRTENCTEMVCLKNCSWNNTGNTVPNCPTTTTNGPVTTVHHDTTRPHHHHCKHHHNSKHHHHKRPFHPSSNEHDQCQQNDSLRAVAVLW